MISLKALLKHHKGWLRPAVVLWALGTVITAFYIPEFDFGFDGIKFWFYLSLLMLSGFLLLAAALRHFFMR